MLINSIKIKQIPAFKGEIHQKEFKFSCSLQKTLHLTKRINKHNKIFLFKALKHFPLVYK